MASAGWRARRRSHRLKTTRRIPSAAHQQPEHVVQALEDFVYAKRPHPGSRKFDCQRDAFQPSANCRHHCAACGVKVKLAWTATARSTNNWTAG